MNHPDASLSSDRMQRCVCWIALGALLWKSWACCAATHRRRLSSTPAAPPEPLQRWEGEGGQNQQRAAGITPP